MPRGHDVDTRDRLINAAARLFADRGHAHVTIRDICASSQANIAAVNYHYSSKDELYQEVVAWSVKTMQAATQAAVQSGAGLAAEARLRMFVRTLLQETVSGEYAWLHQLLAREISEPTPALNQLMPQVVEPRLAFLREIVAELLGADASDPRAVQCAFSIHALCLVCTHRPLVARFAPLTTADALQAHADHITEFSLAGLWALARTT